MGKRYKPSKDAFDVQVTDGVDKFARLVAERLNTLMKEYRFNAAEVVARSEGRTSLTNLYFWRRGLAVPSTESLMILADVFGTSTDFILGRTEQR